MSRWLRVAEEAVENNSEYLTIYVYDSDMNLIDTVVDKYGNFSRDTYQEEKQAIEDYLRGTYPDFRYWDDKPVDKDISKNI